MRVRAHTHTHTQSISKFKLMVNFVFASHIDIT